MTNRRIFAGRTRPSRVCKTSVQKRKARHHAGPFIDLAKLPTRLRSLFGHHGFVVGLGLGAILLSVGKLLAPNRPDPETLSPYECGFEPFDDARIRFDVRYYLVAILFIIFDLEVAFLFPWAVSLVDLGVFGFWSMIVFLAVLTVGFVYEWKKGALEWE